MMISNPNIEACSSYTDAAQKVRQVKHTVRFTDTEIREFKDKIVEDLCRILTR